jgi:hypothetical protein
MPCEGLTPGDGELPTSVGEFPQIQKTGRADNSDESSKNTDNKKDF